MPPGQSVKPPLTRSQRLEHFRNGSLVHNGPEVSGVKAAPVCHDALLVGGKSLDLPLRQKEVREGQWDPAEDPADDLRPSDRPIEVHHVRELVDENEAQPVIGLSDELGAGRPRGSDDNRVVGKGSGKTIGQLSLVGQDDVRLLRHAQAKASFGIAPDLFG